MQISATKIKALRQNNGWSQELLAQASGLSLRTVQRVEKGETCSAETQLALAAVFNISPVNLSEVSDTPDVTWKRNTLMQNILALTIIGGAIAMLLMLGGELAQFIDFYSIAFILLFTYAATAIAYGGNGIIKSLTGLRYLFSQEIHHNPASEYLSLIYQRQIYFTYGGAFIALLIGSVSIHSSEEAITSSQIFHAAYAVNILILVYAAIIAEAVFRPLVAKLENRKVEQPIN